MKYLFARIFVIVVNVIIEWSERDCNKGLFDILKE